MKDHQEQVYSVNGILFDKKPFIVKSWFPNISYEKASIESVPIWIKLPKLNVMYWSEYMLKDIVDYLGTVLKADTSTITKSRMSYARVLVDMNIVAVLQMSHTSRMRMMNSYPNLFSLILPVWCGKCSQFWHTPMDCRMGKQRPIKP